MQIDELRKAAMDAIAQHEAEYGVTAPQRLKDFFASSFTEHHLRFAEPSPAPSGFPPKVGFQLELVPPSWQDKDDDAINGPNGELATGKTLDEFLARLKASSDQEEVFRTEEGPEGFPFFELAAGFGGGDA